MKMKLCTKSRFHLLIISCVFVVSISSLPVDDEKRDKGSDTRDAGSDTRDAGSDTRDAGSDTRDTPYENKYSLTSDTVDEKGETDSFTDKSNKDSNVDVNEKLDTDAIKPFKKEEIILTETYSTTKNDDNEGKITKRSAEVRDEIVCRCYKESNPDSVLTTKYTSNIIQSYDSPANYDVHCSGRQNSGGFYENSGRISSEIVNGDTSILQRGLPPSDSAGDSTNGVLTQGNNIDSSFVANSANHFADSRQLGGDFATVGEIVSSDPASNLNSFETGQVIVNGQGPLGEVVQPGDASLLIGDTSAWTEDTSALTGDMSLTTGDTFPLTGDTSALVGHTSASTDMSALTGDISHLTGDTSFTTGDTFPLTGDTSALVGDTSASTGDLSALTGDTSHLTGDVSALTVDISHSTGDMSLTTGDTFPLTGVASALVGDTSASTGDMSALTGDISHLTEDMSALTGDISHLTEDMSDLTGDISHLTGDMSLTTGDTFPLTGDTSALVGDTSASTGNMSALTGDISHLTGDMSALTGDISHLTGDISFGNNEQPSSDVTGFNLGVDYDKNIGAILNSESETRTGNVEGSFNLEGFEETSYLTGDGNVQNLDVSDITSDDTPAGNEQSSLGLIASEGDSGVSSVDTNVQTNSETV